jgi:membrane protease subunit (stomatin/prohibitin family)
MGLFDKLKGEFIDVIDYLDDTQSTLVYKFDRKDNEIKNGAQLTVRESQVAVFMNEGKLADIFTPGRYELTTQNLPILTTLKSWKHGFSSPFKADVFFVSTKTFTGQKWGTKNPIPLRDPEFGVIRLRAFGSFSFRVNNVEKLIKEITGTNSDFQIEDMDSQLKSLVVTEFTDAIGELKLPALDLAANYKELGSKIEGFLNEGFGEMGLEIRKFLIENISMPPEVEAAIDKRSQMNVLGNLDQFAKFQAANAMEKAASSGGDGGMMGAGMGMGMGMGMANMMNQAFSGSAQPSQQAPAGPPPIPGAVSFFIAINGQQQGPLNLDQLKASVSQGQLNRDTLVWKQGMPAWTKAGEVTELSGLFGSAPPPLPPQM